MPRSSYTRTNFLGGEWAPEAQGRIDRPDYNTALETCLNTIPIETGANVRRSGTEWIMPTWGRTTAKLISFVPDSARPYVGVFTTTRLMLALGTSPVFDMTDPVTVTAASYDSSYFTITVADSSDFTAGDLAMLTFPDDYDPAFEAGLRNRVLQIHTVPDGTHLTLANDINGALTGHTLPAGGLVGAALYKMLVVTGTPWTTSYLSRLRAVQAGEHQVILSEIAAPQIVTEDTAPTNAAWLGLDDRVYVVTAENGGTDYAVEVLRPFLGQTEELTDAVFCDRIAGRRAIVQADFSIAPAVFIDGPYLDPQADTGTVSGGSGSITFTPASTTFTSADVGRHIRFYSQPAAYASGTTYAKGALVFSAGAAWESMAGSNTGNTPGTAPIASGSATAWWAPAPTACVWAWGVISAQASSSCTVTLTAGYEDAGGAQGTIPTAANGTTITSWRLGAYMAGSYPTCGTFYEGRLGLAGAVSNRLDFSMSNVLLQFSPTDQYGNVNDNNAISETLNSTSVDQIYWLEPDHEGVLMGTLGGEWLIQASTLNDPLTPTSIQIHRVTKYGSANIEPRRTGMALVYVQRYRKRVLEYLSDTLSGRFTAKHLNEFALHLVPDGIEEITYQEEPVPILWARTTNGQLIGVTYRRVSRFVSETPVYNAWHRHVIGGGV